MSASSQKPLPDLPKKTLRKDNCCSKIVNSIFSIRYKKRDTANNDELYLRTTLRNFVIYLVFLAVITTINFGTVSLSKFYFSDGMASLYLDTPLQDGATFRNGFKNYSQLWEFLGKTLPHNLYFETWYDTKKTKDQDLGFIQYNNKLLGVPRITQLRISDQTCKLPSAVAFMKNCKVQFDSKSVETKPFGKGLTGINNTDVTFSAWFYSSDDVVSTDREAIVSTYPPNGYVIDLANKSDDTTAIIQDLQVHRWIDANTRLLTIDFTVYNGNINMFSQVKLIIEFPSTGGMLTSWSINTVQLLRYVDFYGYFVMACEIIYIAFIIFYTLEEIFDIRYNKCKYFKDIYNLIDIVIILMSYAVILFSVYRTYKVEVLLEAILRNTTSFQNFSTLTSWSDTIDKMSAIILFFAWVKIFKFVAINQTLNQLNETLGNSAMEIVSFMIVFAIVFISYAGTGYLLFGQDLKDYQTFTKTLFTLFRIVLGDFDFVSLRRVAPWAGPIYFMSYVFFCFFVLMNMFVAIINNSYTQVKEENAKLAPEFMISDYLKLNYSRIVEKLTLRKNRILDIQNIIENENLKNAASIPFVTWRREMRKKGYADSEIEAIFSKYDTDCDRVLSPKEKMFLMSDIKAAKSNVVQEFVNFKREHKDTPNHKHDVFSVGSTKNNNTDNASVNTGETLVDKFMTHEQFKYSCERIDRAELLVANIIQKLDKLFIFLELMEYEKIKRRETALTDSKSNLRTTSRIQSALD